MTSRDNLSGNTAFFWRTISPVETFVVRIFDHYCRNLSLLFRCEADYNATYAQFCSTAPQPVKDYFNKNWHPIKEEWVMAFKFSVPNFQNATNNRLEILNGKLKSVINLYSSMEEFIKHFFIILECLRGIRSGNVAYSCQKDPVLPYAADSPEAAYMNLLTRYSSAYVLAQIQLAHEHVYQWGMGNAGTYQIQTSDGVINVTHSTCSCLFFSSMLLPCRHIFSLRKKSGVSLFDSSLCDQRWTRSYFRSEHRVFQSTSAETQTTVEITAAKSSTKMTSQQKYSGALLEIKKVANALSMFNDDEFHRKLHQVCILIVLARGGGRVGCRTYFEIFYLLNLRIDDIWREPSTLFPLVFLLRNLSFCM